MQKVDLMGINMSKDLPWIVMTSESKARTHDKHTCTLAFSSSNKYILRTMIVRNYRNSTEGL
jgi:hypothetical protein